MKTSSLTALLACQSVTSLATSAYNIAPSTTQEWNLEARTSQMSISKSRPAPTGKGQIRREGIVVDAECLCPTATQTIYKNDCIMCKKAMPFVTLHTTFTNVPPFCRRTLQYKTVSRDECPPSCPDFRTTTTYPIASANTACTELPWSGY
jgi:hypothetical protein